MGPAVTTSPQQGEQSQATAAYAIIIMHLVEKQNIYKHADHIS